MLALELLTLNKRYASHQAVNNLSLQIPQGSFYALLGPNGAGKTTTLRMVAGLLQPDNGDAVILGHSITKASNAAKQLLAYIPDEPLIYGKLRPMEYLEFIAGLWGISAQKAERYAQELLKQLNLWEIRGDLSETFVSILFTSFFVSLWFSLGDVRQKVVLGTIPDIAIWLAVGVWLLGFLLRLNDGDGIQLSCFV